MHFSPVRIRSHNSEVVHLIPGAVELEEIWIVLRVLESEHVVFGVIKVTMEDSNSANDGIVIVQGFDWEHFGRCFEVVRLHCEWL